MDELVKSSIKLVEARKKDKVPWEFDRPHEQPVHHWDGEQWVSSKAYSDVSLSGPVEALHLWSWNIDFMLPFPNSRMNAAIRHLEALIKRQQAPIPNIIFLNECVESDLKLIASDKWIRQTFSMTDVDTSCWQSGHYGTITLVDRRLPIARCFRVHYSQTRMERDGLFVDIKIDVNKSVRLCNTHLESLALEPAYRPPQMQMCASYMHDKNLHGAILAGDLNAIQDFDKHLHSDNDLKDAYLELGGSDDDAVGGHTWGQQAATAQRQRFGTCRMDKVFYCGGVRATSFERFGVDVEVEDEREKKQIVALGFDKPWVTDHLGVTAVLEFTKSPPESTREAKLV